MVPSAIVAGLVLAVTLGAWSPASALELGALADPRPQRWTLDHSRQLRPDTVRALDGIGRTVKEGTGHELVVVCVASTDGAEQRPFATRLFNRWGVGDRRRDDGVVLFAALRDRQVHIILGDGLDDEARVATSQAIVDAEMVPRFRAGDPDGALLAGARAVAGRLLGAAVSAPPPAAATPAPARRAASDVPLPAEAPPEARPSPIASASPDHPPRSPAPSRPSVPLPTHHPEPSQWRDDGRWGLGSIVGGGLAGIVGIVGLRRWLRNRPRMCRRCRMPMVRLDEVDDDDHLDRGERIEERVGSVDYDVWCCRACAQVLKLRYGAVWTSYARCPQCRAVTRSSRRTTLVAADYDHEGRIRIDESCAACSYRHRFIQYLPRLTRGDQGAVSFASGPSDGGASFGSAAGGSSASDGGGGQSSGHGGGGGW